MRFRQHASRCIPLLGYAIVWTMTLGCFDNTNTATPTPELEPLRIALLMPSIDGARIDTVCAYTAADPSTNEGTTATECAGMFNDYGDRAGWCKGGRFNVGL